MAGIEAPATGESRRERLPPLPPTATAPVVDSTEPGTVHDDGFEDLTDRRYPTLGVSWLEPRSKGWPLRASAPS